MPGYATLANFSGVELPKIHLIDWPGICTRYSHVQLVRCLAEYSMSQLLYRILGHITLAIGEKSSRTSSYHEFV